MNNSFGLKVIAVLDVNTLKLFKGDGLKIVEEISQYQLHEKHTHDIQRHETLRGNKSGLSAFHDSHTSKKDIEYAEAVRVSISHIEDLFASDNDYKELYIVASTKLLGHVRSLLSSNLKKKLAKEINKDLVHLHIKELEKAIFA